MDFVKRNYAILCFAIAIFFLLLMIATTSAPLGALSGLAGALAGFAGLAFLRKKRAAGLDDTPASQTQE